MKKNGFLILMALMLFAAGFWFGTQNPGIVHAQGPQRGGIPKSYGRLVDAVVNPQGTALVFEDSHGTIRFVTITGEEEAELTRD